MLWFYDLYENKNVMIEVFQYISCYGSTEWKNRGFYFFVQFQYISCYGSTFFVHDKELRNA